MRGKSQTAKDRDGGSYAYTSSTDDPDGKITGAQGKLRATYDKACGGLSPSELAKLHLCGNDAAAIKSCIVSAATKTASGLTAAAFEFRGVCPSAVDVSARVGAAAGTRLSPTRFDMGFSGLDMGQDIPAGFTGRVNLACTDADCSTCAVTVSCTAGNCRCADDVSVECDEPFGADLDDCAGAECEVYFGAPWPRIVAGIPVCIVDKVVSELVATANAGTGSSSTLLKTRLRVHIGDSHAQPCPSCDAGVCKGGERDGLSCGVDQIDETFGAMSYDCLPLAATNIAGDLWETSRTYTDGHQSLPFATPCDFPSLDCACAQCSGDTTMVCVDDAECGAVGAGTCTANTGASRLPNACLTGVCTSTGAGPIGECATGPDDLYCDGVTLPDGRGVIPCWTNADCAAFGAIFADPGSCSLVIRRPCFLDPITSSGVSAQHGALLAASFCVPPADSSWINLAVGLPGPARFQIAWDFNSLCPDGVTEWELGGANCP